MLDATLAPSLETTSLRINSRLRTPTLSRVSERFRLLVKTPMLSEEDG